MLGIDIKKVEMSEKTSFFLDNHQRKTTERKRIQAD
jgi:hypothetical protein